MYGPLKLRLKGAIRDETWIDGLPRRVGRACGPQAPAQFNLNFHAASIHREASNQNNHGVESQVSTANLGPYPARSSPIAFH